MSWSNKARAKGHRPVQNTCQECGEPYEVSRTARSTSKRCPNCQSEFLKAYYREKNRERRLQQAKEGHGLGRYDGEYRIIQDPDDTWGWDSRLHKSEVESLTQLGYLTPGTIFEHGSGNRLKVIRKGRGLALKAI